MKRQLTTFLQKNPPLQLIAVDYSPPFQIRTDGSQTLAIVMVAFSEDNIIVHLLAAYIDNGYLQSHVASFFFFFFAK